MKIIIILIGVLFYLFMWTFYGVIDILIRCVEN